MRPLCVDMYSGLHGWAEAFVDEGYRVIAVDIVDMCKELGYERPEGIELWLRDVRSLHGSQFRAAAVIVASPPCQAYSYRAMPWSRAKALPPPDNTLFNECFRIQREASEAAGRYIPLIVENVRGAQKWVGRAAWHYGSFYLWGDVPALMPMTLTGKKVPGFRFDGSGGSFQTAAVKETSGFKTSGMNWSDQSKRGQDFTRIAGKQAAEGIKVGMASEREGQKIAVYSDPRRNGGKGSHITRPQENLEKLYADRDIQGVKQHGSGHIWCRTGNGALPSKSSRRRAASALIAKIPYPLALHIAKCFYPKETP